MMVCARLSAHNGVPPEDGAVVCVGAGGGGAVVCVGDGGAVVCVGAGMAVNVWDAIVVGWDVAVAGAVGVAGFACGSVHAATTNAVNEVKATIR